MNNRKYEFEKVNFHHLVLEGTHYEVGQQMARLLDTIPGWRDFASSSKINLKKVRFSNFIELWEYTDEYCPGVTQEIQGFADYFEVSPEIHPFWNWTFNDSLGGECSQLAVLPRITANQHTLVGRSYEWNHKEEDMKLITTRIKGKAAHIGFSCLLHGRHDGMNEHGLVVSMTGGGIFGVPFKQRGPMFWLTIRTILDTCTSVDHALKYLVDLSVNGYFSLLLADQQANAAIVEFAEGKKFLHQINDTGDQSYLFSVNHYRSPEMEEFNKLNCGIITHSKIREKLITKWSQSHTSKISTEDVRTLFATLHPEGLCNHFYTGGFGTLWSMIFDLNQMSVDVCFSAPTHNKYHTFDLSSVCGIIEYPTTVPITEWY